MQYLPKTVTFRIDPLLHQRICFLAKSYGESAAGFCRQLVSRGVDVEMGRDPVDPVRTLGALITRLNRSHVMLLQALAPEVWFEGELESFIRKANEQAAADFRRLNLGDLGQLNAALRNLENGIDQHR